jgi:hypothetical protein
LQSPEATKKEEERITKKYIDVETMKGRLMSRLRHHKPKNKGFKEDD